MSRISAFCLAGIAAVTFSGPAGASATIQDLTCGQFLSRDAAGRGRAAADLLEWIACDETCAIEGSLLVLLYDMTAQQVELHIEARCLGQPADTNVVARLKEDM